MDASRYARPEAARFARAASAVVSAVALVVTGAVLALIPFWTGALDRWSPGAVLAPVIVVAAIAATGLAMMRAPRWARAAACGIVACLVHLVAVHVFCNVSSFEWMVVWVVGTGSIVVAAVGGMLSAIYQRSPRHSTA
ncbi:MAG: hypothetical protein J0I14_02975 [Propionibacteriaceae bacterium]|nr:hypothetical protein [Propionibacteriaceae bacterium]